MVAARTLGWCSDKAHESQKRTALRGMGGGCTTDVFFNCRRCKSTLMIPMDDDEDPTVIEPVRTMRELIEFERENPTVRIKPLRMEAA